MPVLKIKKTDGTWQEVWGCMSTGTGSGAMPKLTTVTIPTDGWTESTSYYSQVISVNGVNVNSRLEMLPTPAQISILQESEISLTITNNNGVVTVYSFYGKPEQDLQMQILITDVEVIV